MQSYNINDIEIKPASNIEIYINELKSSLEKLSNIEAEVKVGQILDHLWEEMGLFEKALKSHNELHVKDLNKIGANIITLPSNFYDANKWRKQRQAIADKIDKAGSDQQIIIINFIGNLNASWRGDRNRRKYDACRKIYGELKDGNFKVSVGQGYHKPNIEWIKECYRKQRQELPSNNQADLEVVELYKEKYGLSISPRTIQRFTGR